MQISFTRKLIDNILSLILTGVHRAMVFLFLCAYALCFLFKGSFKMLSNTSSSGNNKDMYQILLDFHI